MGYNISLTDSRFRIEESNLKPALIALQNAVSDRMESLNYCNGADVIKSKSLRRAVQHMGWRLRFEEEDRDEGTFEGAVIGISFDGEYAGEEDFLFNAIGPFVAAGSFIEILGAEGERWRYVFDGSACRRVEGKMDWGEAGMTASELLADLRERLEKGIKSLNEVKGSIKVQSGDHVSYSDSMRLAGKIDFAGVVLDWLRSYPSD